MPVAVSLDVESVTTDDTAIGLPQTAQRLLPATFPESYVRTTLARNQTGEVLLSRIFDRLTLFFHQREELVVQLFQRKLRKPAAK